MREGGLGFRPGVCVGWGWGGGVWLVRILSWCVCVEGGWVGICPGVWGVSYGMIISRIPYVAPPLFQRVVFLWEDRQA